MVCECSVWLMWCVLVYARLLCVWDVIVCSVWVWGVRCQCMVCIMCLFFCVVLCDRVCCVGVCGEHVVRVVWSVCFMCV